MAVLEAHGVDVSDFAAQDLSLNEDMPGTQRDLQDAVRQLAEKTQGRAAAAASGAAERNALQKELAVAAASREELERRMEELRAHEEATREEFDAIVADGEDLRAKIAELSELLELAERRASSSEDTVSSEVQALEEENIALMRDNRELRKEAAALKASIDKLQGQIAKLSAGAWQAVAPAAASEAPKSHGKENRGLSQHNAEGGAEPGSDRKRANPGASAIKPSPAVAGTPLEDAVGGAKKTHKKAKQVVTAPDRGATEDGECAQS